MLKISKFEGISSTALMVHLPNISRKRSYWGHPLWTYLLKRVFSFCHFNCFLMRFNFLFYFYFYSSNVFHQDATQTHDLKIKGPMLFWLTPSGAPSFPISFIHTSQPCPKSTSPIWDSLEDICPPDGTSLVPWPGLVDAWMFWSK